MVALYAVSGILASALENEFASAIHRPSSRAWQPTDVAGHRVLVARTRDFVVAYWAVDGLVLHLGASAKADLTSLVERLAADSWSVAH